MERGEGDHRRAGPPKGKGEDLTSSISISIRYRGRERCTFSHPLSELRRTVLVSVGIVNISLRPILYLQVLYKIEGLVKKV